MKLKKEIIFNFFIVTSFGIALVLVLLRYYINNQIVSGGEGAYFLDYLTLFKNYSSSWINSGTGLFSTSLNFAYLFHLIALQIFFPNEKVLNFIVVFLIYFLPFIASYFLLLELKLKRSVSFFLSLFYIFNPFSLIFLNSLNQWNVLILYILPAYLWLVLHFYENNIKLFIFFGFHSLLFSFTNANPPLMVVQQIAIILITIFSIIYKEKNLFSFPQFIRKYLVIFSAFLIFNLWWICQWAYIYRDAQVGYTTQFALDWLNGEAKTTVPVLTRSLTLQNLMVFPLRTMHDYIYNYYGYIFSPIILFIPIVVILVSLFEEKNDKAFLYVISSFLLTLFLSKGTGGFFGELYKFIIIHIPFFNIFKTAPEKWGTLSIFLLLILFGLIYKNITKYKYKKIIYFLSVIYLFFISVPFISGNLIYDYFRSFNFYGSKHFIDKKEYIDTRNLLNDDRNNYRIISFPGNNNYQVALNIEGNRYYTGNDPILNNVNKEFIAPYNGSWTQRFNIFYKNISDQDYLKMYGLFNVGKIIINKDMYPWFGFSETESVSKIERIFDRNIPSIKNGPIDIYDTQKYFVPRIYIPINIINTQENLDDVIKVISQNEKDFTNRSAISFDSNNSIVSAVNQIPKISFYQVNPAKYKIEIENAKDKFMIILSESFHPGWKLYINNSSRTKLNLQIEKSISYFGNDITEIISKNNKIDHNPFETLFIKPINEKQHSIINGYANAWTIYPSDSMNSSNYEIILEFYPQRYFYLGIIVAILGFFVSILVLFFPKIKKIIGKS